MRLNGQRVLSTVERVIDRTVGMLFPGLESRMMAARMRNLSLRQFAAAKESRLLGDWAPVGTDINTLIRTSNPTIRNRTRQLVGDFAYFARAAKNLVDFTVGEGIAFQSRITRTTGKAGKPELDSTSITRIEDARKWWMDECDAAGRLHYHEMERMWRRQDVVDGESLLVFVWDKRPGRFLPLALQAYEADWLSSEYSVALGDNLVDQGLEFDRRTGRVIAAHFRVPDGFSPLTGNVRSQRVPAEHFVHGFESLRPGQLRGISPFTPAILLADDLQEFIGANIDRAKMASKWLAFVQTADVARWQKGRTTNDTETGHKLTVLDNAIIDFLNPGDEVKVNTADVPGESFSPFAKFILQMLAVSVGVPYELVSGDYGGLNYNTTRTVRNDFAKAIRPIIRRHCRQFGVQVNRAFFDALYLTGKVNMPGYQQNPRHWSEGLWQPPGIEPLDLLRESRGQIDLVKNLLYSPQEIIASRGRDPEEMLNEIQEFKRMLEQRGLTIEEVSTALQTNPAAVAGNPTAASKQEEQK